MRLLSERNSSLLEVIFLRCNRAIGIFNQLSMIEKKKNYYSLTMKVKAKLQFVHLPSSNESW